MRSLWLYVLSVAVVCEVTACESKSGDKKTQPPVTASNHPWFPISEASTHALGKLTPDGELTCDGCHRPSASSFKAVRCDNCHKHSEAITQRLHLGFLRVFNVDTSAITDVDLKAEARGARCYSCHQTGEKIAFTHTLISNDCAQCHASGNAFAALPKPGFTHMEVGTADCGGCHVIATWATTSGAPKNIFDPTQSVTVASQEAAWIDTSIVSVTDDQQSIPMIMDHSSTQIPANVLSSCAGCHPQADQGQYYPGSLHASLANLSVPQPAKCDECHGHSAPVGFVGVIDSTRSPPSRTMRHEAVEWVSNAPTATKVVSNECQLCHQSPATSPESTWSSPLAASDAGVAQFHESLTLAERPQPQSCLDCHANSRPAAELARSTFRFDHVSYLGDCRECHAATNRWDDGVFHQASKPAPTTCLPCHTNNRPTSTADWKDNFTASPFDYVTNVNGVTHGADQDCSVCHVGSGSGNWGVDQNWQNGLFIHTASSVAGTSCILCHTTQRPDLLTPPADAGFDHLAQGTGDCNGCHQSTVTRDRYVDLYPIPGGDWRDGQHYPGDRLISTPGSSIRIPSTRLIRTGTWVTGISTTTVTLPNAFLHTSPAIPSEIHPGPAGSPKNDTCWHCHTSTGTTVTSFTNGWFHAALTNYRATPTSAVTPLPQPTTCNDCHDSMRPPDVVTKLDAGTWIAPMDHSAQLAGASVSSVAAMQCGQCHQTPGSTSAQWTDGKFHSKLATAVSPSECVSCHYPLSTTAQADVTKPATGLPPRFVMKHRSSTVTTQACDTCHSMALSQATLVPAVATRWSPGAFHTALTASTQPATCLDCHTSSKPTGSTQSSVVYALAQGGTSSNGAQWMNHTHASTTGRDCAYCHLVDAKVSASAWSKGTPLHSKVASVTTCNRCHGLTNGGGATVGTNNNMPATLIDTATLTTSSAASPGTHDQISHADVNVTGNECNFCHTQIGPSSVVGVAGAEWRQALFHANFTAAQPLITNGTTGRCSNCHMNVKPGPTFAKFDHSSYTATSTQDCSSCHAFPGTSPATPNWKGATGAHAATGPTAASTLDCNTCHGQAGTAAVRLAVAASSHYGGITNGNKCTSCHINFAGFKGTVSNLKYAHTNGSANAGGCVTCHAFSSQLYTTLTTTPSLTLPTTAGGHQFSQTRSVTGTHDGDSFTSTHTNTGLTRCASCHQYAATTATTNIWSFRHEPNNPGVSSSRSSSGCTMCHN